MVRFYKDERRNSRRRRSVEGSLPDLPFDAIEIILSKLPVKSLFRFKSVSKQWKTMISASKFARTHLHESQGSDSRSLFLLGPRLGTPKFSLFKLSYQMAGKKKNLTSPTFQKEASLEFPVENFGEVDILCSCDGLVLLKNLCGSDTKFVLWSPSTRKYRKFSCPYAVGCTITAYGLCYDLFNDDYKVILCITNRSYAVFSLKKCSWICKDDPSVTGLKGLGVLVNGALHWSVITTAGGNISSFGNKYTRELFYFDPEYDNFKNFTMPVFVEANSEFHFTSLRGNLCLYQNTVVWELTIDIWMMNEYGNHDSWTRLPTIENMCGNNHVHLLRWFSAEHNEFVYDCQHVKPLFMTKDGNIVLHVGSSSLVLYLTKEKKFGNFFKYKPRRFFQAGSAALVCLDSLISPRSIYGTMRNQSGTV